MFIAFLPFFLLDSVIYYIIAHLYNRFICMTSEFYILIKVILKQPFRIKRLVVLHDNCV